MSSYTKEEQTILTQALATLLLDQLENEDTENATKTAKLLKEIAFS